MKKEKLAAGSRILFLLPLALIVIFFECVPLGGMVLKSITDHGTLTMEFSSDSGKTSLYSSHKEQLMDCPFVNGSRTDRGFLPCSGIEQ